MTLSEPITPLLRLDQLLVRHTADAEFLEDLLAWSTGARTWRSATEDYLREEHVLEAAYACRHISEIEGRSALARKIEPQWAELRARWQTRWETLQTQHVSIAGGPPSDGVQEVIDEAGEYLRICYSHLEVLSTSLTTLTQVPLADTEQIPALLEQAALSLELVSAELAEQAAKRRDECKKLAREIDDALYDLLDSPDLEESAERLAASKRDAFKNRDADRLKSILQAAEALSEGESVDIDGLAPALARQQATPPASRPTRPQRKPAPSQSRNLSFSSLTLGLLDKVLPSSTSHYQPGGQFEPAQVPVLRVLQSDIAALLPHVSRLDQEQQRRDEAMGKYLLQQAKIYLLQERFHNARTLFGDLLVWLGESARQGESSTLVLEYRRTAIWGFTLAFLLLHESSTNAQSVVTPHNLETLFRYPFGEKPLARLERNGLFEEFGRQILLLGSPTADDVLHDFLLDYFYEHPIALQEFSAGLFRQSSADLDTLRRILEFVLTVSIEDEPELMQEIGKLASRLELLPESGRARRFASGLRTVLSASATRFSLVQAIYESLARSGEPQSTESGESPIASRLLTRVVVVGDDIETRVVLTVTGGVHIEPLFGLRLEISLLDDQDQVIKNAFRDPPIIDCLRAGERRELPVHLRATEVGISSTLGGEYRIRTRYSVADAQGTWQPLRVHHESFALTIASASNQEPRPTPYIVGDAVTAREHIFGRQDQVERIYESLRGRIQDNIVLVLGDRRIGKTTLLNALVAESRIQERYRVCVSLDQEDINHQPTAFFARLIDRIQLALQEAGHPMHRQIRRRSMKEDPGYHFRSFMQLVDRALERRDERMLLILDELEKVYKSIAAGRDGGSGLPGEVIASLRATIQECRRVGFVLAGVTDVLKAQISSSEDRLFKLALIVEMAPLDTDSARELIQRPVADEYAVATQAADYLASQTGGHPYLLQCVCHYLYLHMTRRQARVATLTDVEDVLESKILPDSAFFSYLTEPWRDDRKDYSLLRAVAHLQANQRYQFGDRYRPHQRYVPVPDIQRHASRNGVVLETDYIRDRLLQLCESMPTVIVQSQKAEPAFGLRIGLLARHLRWLETRRQSLVLHE